MADIEDGRPMQKDSIFQIMSMTKPVTAIGIIGRPAMLRVVVI